MPTPHNRTESGPGGLGHLRRLAYFVAVVETGSFTAAAERLGITKAVVSQQVARLERECRTSLLVRTTRKVHTTELGQAFYQRCAAILRDTDDAFDTLTDTAAEPSGLLRLTAPLDYGVRVVVPAIAAFTRRYPACKVDAILSDQTLDLMTANIELAIRVGWLAESSLQARKIGAFRQLLVAPSTMTAQLAGLTAPQDIATLPFIANTALRDHQRWHFAHATHAPQSVDVQPGIFLDATSPCAKRSARARESRYCRIMWSPTIWPQVVYCMCCRSGSCRPVVSMRWSRQRAFDRQKCVRSWMCCLSRRRSSTPSKSDAASRSN